jgi:hypothetical protein
LNLGVHVAAIFCFLAPGVSAGLLSTRLRLPLDRGTRTLSIIVLWQLLQLIPVQSLAALEIAGGITRVTIAKIATLQAILLLICILWVAATRSIEVAASSPKRTPPRWPWYVAAAAVVVGTSYLVFAIDTLSSYLSGSDALAYHLPLALGWLQRGSLAIPASRAWRYSLPGNAEVGMMLLLATGKESASILVNWIAMAALSIASYLLARQMCRGERLPAATATLLLISIPIIEFQTYSAYVDLFGTAFLFASLALLVHRKESLDASGSSICGTMVFLSAAACGVSLGTKPIYYLYGGAASLFILFCLYRDSAERRTRFLRSLALMVVGILLPSWFWFARASAATGNPVFPMRVSVGNHVFLPGYTPSEITDLSFEDNFVRSRGEWLVYPWTEWKRNPGYLMIPYGEGSGVGAAFASIVVVGLLFLTYRAFVLPSSGTRDRLLLLVLVASLLPWWFALHRVPRFGLPILVFACILATPFIQVLQSYRGHAFAILLLGSITITTAISGFVPLHALLGRARTRQWSRARFYSYPRVLDNLPSGSCVLNYTGLDEKNFALAGEKLWNCVVPAFEVHHPLTMDFLRDHHVDFVAEIASANQAAWPPLQSGALLLIREEDVKSGADNLHWRIWKVERP